MVDAGFEELDLDEGELVVEAFELAQERVDQGEGVVVLRGGKVEVHQTSLEGLAEEGAAGLRGPGNAGFGQGDLRLGCIGDGVEEVEELADWRWSVFRAKVWLVVLNEFTIPLEMWVRVPTYRSLQSSPWVNSTARSWCLALIWRGRPPSSRPGTALQGP